MDQPPLEPGEIDGHLRGVHNESLDRELVDNLTGEGVERELVVGVEVGEVVFGEGGFGGFPVRYVVVALELTEPVHVAAEPELFPSGGFVIGFHAEAQLHRGFSVVQHYGLDWVVAELLQVPDYGSEEGEAVFVWIVGVPRSAVPKSRLQSVAHGGDGRGVVAGSGDFCVIVTLKSSVIDLAEDEVDVFLPGLPATRPWLVTHGILIQSAASFEIAQRCGIEVDLEIRDGSGKCSVHRGCHSRVARL